METASFELECSQRVGLISVNMRRAIEFYDQTGLAT